MRTAARGDRSTETRNASPVLNRQRSVTNVAHNQSGRIGPCGSSASHCCSTGRSVSGPELTARVRYASAVLNRQRSRARCTDDQIAAVDPLQGIYGDDAHSAGAVANASGLRLQAGGAVAGDDNVAGVDARIADDETIAGSTQQHIIVGIGTVGDVQRERVV